MNKKTYGIYILLLAIAFCFFSCGKDTEGKRQKRKISFSPPEIIGGRSPIVILSDSRPKPKTILIPIKDSVSYTVQTQTGTKTLKLPPPITTPIREGEAGGYTYMQNYNTEQGLGLSSIGCGYKDKIGNLWFGTTGGGVSKYDGKSFTNFTTVQGLANNLVKCILEDKNGNLWFGTNGGGASKYDGKSFTNYTTEQGLVNNRVSCITEDKSGNLWFSCSNGISRLSHKHIPSANSEAKTISLFTNFTIADGLLSNGVNVCFTDKKGNIWFGTDQGINKITADSVSVTPKGKLGGTLFTNYTTAQGLSNSNVSCISEDKKGNLWFGTFGGGVNKYNPSLNELSKTKIPTEESSRFTNYILGKGSLCNNVYCITEDKSGNLWFGTGEGLSRLSPDLSSPFTHFTVVQGLSSNIIRSITADKTGNLWIGTAPGGLSKYEGNACTSFTLDQGLIVNKIWGITEDKKENLWFVGGGGISKFNRKSFTNFSVPYLMPYIRCVTEDKNGNIWFGTSFGATKYDGASFTNYTTEQGMVHNVVLCIVEDKKGNLWFGTYGGGVSKYDGNRVEAIEKGENVSFENKRDLKKVNGKFVSSFTNYTTAQGLADNTIKCILEDKKGNMWFGTNEKGLSKYACPDKGGNSSFTNFSRTQGLSNNTILSILEDKTGAFWFGTAGGGVCKYDPKPEGASSPFTSYTTAQGLADDMVYDMVEDTLSNMIWFGTNLGLSGLKLNTLTAGAAGAKFENFNNHTGYPIKDLNKGALFLDKKGIVWARATA